MVRQHEPKETPRELAARADLQETPREPAVQADLPEEQEEPTKGAAVAGLRVAVEELVTEVKKLVTRSDSSEDGGDEDLGGGGLDAVEHLVRRSPHLLQRLRERLRVVVALGVSAVDIEALDDRIHAAVELVSGIRSSVCYGFGVKKNACRLKAVVTTESFSTGTCGRHRAQRSACVGLGRDPAYRHDACGLCRLAAPGGEEDPVIVCPFTGEPYHVGCVRLKFAVHKADLTVLSQEDSEIIVVSERGLSRFLGAQMVFDPSFAHRLFTSPGDMTFVVLPTEIPWEAAGRGHAAYPETCLAKALAWLARRGTKVLDLGGSPPSAGETAVSPAIKALMGTPMSSKAMRLLEAKKGKSPAEAERGPPSAAWTTSLQTPFRGMSEASTTATGCSNEPNTTGPSTKSEQHTRWTHAATQWAQTGSHRFSTPPWMTVSNTTGQEKTPGAMATTTSCGAS